MIPAVILSSHTVGLSLIRCLGCQGIPVIVLYYEKKDMGYVSKYVKNKFFVPHPEREKDNFISILLDCAKKYKGAVLFPADDATLTTVSQNKELLSSYYRVACPGWDITEKYIDKKYTYNLADRLGIPSPKSLEPLSLEDVEKYSHLVEYPCLIKPRKSHIFFDRFKIKMIKVKNRDLLMRAYKETYAAGIDVIIQKYIPGDKTMGINYNSYFANNEPLVEFTAQKCRMRPPEFGVPCAVRSAHIPEAIESGRKVIKALGFNGYSCTEFKKDSRDGVFKLLEVNGRHNRSGLLAVKSGVNFPLIQYKHLAIGEIPVAKKYKSDIYWIDEISDISNFRKYMHTDNHSLSNFLKPYCHSHVFAVFDIRDPKPFIKRISNVILIGLGGIFLFSILHKLFRKKIIA